MTRAANAVWFGYGAQITPTLIDECLAAEAAGLDAVLIPEHQGIPAWSSNPLLLSYKIGMATSSIMVGSLPILLPLYHPVRVAETARFIQDDLGGRLILGVGGGYVPSDFDHFGLKVNERGSRQDEGIEILRLCWSGKPFEFHGRRFDVKAKFGFPPPVSPVPIWVCVGSLAGVLRAGRLGDALVLDGMRTADEIRPLIAAYREEAERYGRVPQVVLQKRVWIGDPEEAVRLMEDAVSRYSREVVTDSDAQWLGDPSTRQTSAEAHEVARKRIIAGDVGEVEAGLVAWMDDVKPDKVVLKLPFIMEEPPIEVVAAQLQALGGIRRSILSRQP